jgi:hypothetical protein
VSGLPLPCVQVQRITNARLVAFRRRPLPPITSYPAGTAPRNDGRGGGVGCGIFHLLFHAPAPPPLPFHSRPQTSRGGHAQGLHSVIAEAPTPPVPARFVRTLPPAAARGDGEAGPDQARIRPRRRL